jgi:hypothetical protein
MDGCFSSSSRSRRNSNHILTLVDRRRWWIQEIAREGPRGPSLKTAARCSCCCGGFVWIKCFRRNEWWSLTLRLDCELEKVSTIIIIGNLLGSMLDEDDKTLFLFFRFCFCLFVCCVFGRTRRLFFGLLSRFCLFFTKCFSVALFSDAWALSN